MSLALFDSVQALTGVGPKTAQALKGLGINTVYDLLYYFPFRYEQLQTLPLAELSDGQKAVVKGIVVTEPTVSYYGYHRSRLSFKLQIDHAVVMVNFFNQPWLHKQITVNKPLAVYGTFQKARLAVTGMKLVAANSDDKMAPVYSVSQHLHQKTLLKLIKQVLPLAKQTGNVIPADWRDQRQFLTDEQIILGMQTPKDIQAGEAARRSAIFREFFLFELQLQHLLHQNSGQTGIAKHYQLPAVNELTKSLPFELTHDQKQAVNQIFIDLKQPRQMRRLLEGDVGSGKTVVAVYAMYSAVTAGYQACLMAPTEILAHQHFEKVQQLLQPFGVRIALLTGSTSAKEKAEIQAELADGTINVVIGTHALIQPAIKFNRLGLAIIDEQHRFGVNQRRDLLAKGDKVDQLSMTATPIPRTLALSLYGQTAVSEIRQLPAGRKPIKSAWVTSNQLREVLTKMKEQLAQGRQIYVVTPLIAASEKTDLKNAQELQARLAAYFKEQTVALLDGQMPGEQKEKIMAAFAAGQINILVATSVIEVGVDVANANLMIIFDADRFGLSQLHQLRGRIGRGTYQSYCYFVADPKNEQAKQRLEIVASTNDGFKLAAEDLKLRGQGNLFGQAQSGLPTFQVGDIVQNNDLLMLAAQAAKETLTADPDLTEADHAYAAKVLKYKQTFI
ncbi:MAG: ATP-dependent DNA helicase RecG [Lactobacillus sp.]|jgi:ATP-dependent DNA helicase RecG|nr:ATP-dependent DNA helicase RecG [Lactobacillus sp.]MCH3906122.1 ATP-dependent DNA helicase RecG [Lactobacillus sp.]MCH3990300.1 ATP-dependent DNA helicase RecG [Lactobacillus sp.]MCH4068985.1 ATP-dependent DNA helicase RecG [Lactobacillus sp.]MCI1303387.1 ATP-dependent DNA helicase RecG [Lactobacillus sp.]